MAGGGHHQLAVGVALQNTALEVETARRLLQSRGGAYPQAGCLKRAVLAREFRQQRLHQLTEGDGGGNRVTRQAAEPAATEFAEGEGFPRLDRQFPEADLPQLFKNGFGVVGFAHRDATGADDHVGLLVGGDKRVTQLRRVVRNNAEVNDLVAQLLQHQVHRQAVGIVNLAVAERLTRQLQLIAG